MPVGKQTTVDSIVSTEFASMAIDNLIEYKTSIKESKLFKELNVVLEKIDFSSYATGNFNNICWKARIQFPSDATPLNRKLISDGQLLLLAISNLIVKTPSTEKLYDDLLIAQCRLAETLVMCDIALRRIDAQKKKASII